MFFVGCVNLELCGKYLFFPMAENSLLLGVLFELWVRDHPLNMVYWICLQLWFILFTEKLKSNPTSTSDSERDDKLVCQSFILKSLILHLRSIINPVVLFRTSKSRYQTDILVKLHLGLYGFVILSYKNSVFWVSIRSYAIGSECCVKVTQ